MDTDDDSISKLLHLKRYEQPPVGYHEAFLREFRRRQRVALMRQPWYAEAWERLADSLPSFANFEVPRMAYAVVTAIALTASAMWMMVNPRETAAPLAAAATDINRSPDFSLEPQKTIFIENAIPVSTSEPQSYIMESKPVRNERPHSF